MKALHAGQLLITSVIACVGRETNWDDVVVVRMLARSLLVTLVVVFIVVVPDGSEAFIAGCWSDWNRECSKWSLWGTGRLWADCDSRCKQLGTSGGRCVEVPSTCWFIKGKVLKCKCDVKTDVRPGDIISYAES